MTDLSIEARVSSTSAPRFVLLREEALVRGFKNPLAFRRWCRRHGVALRLDGRKQWVSPEDVDRAVAALPAVAPQPVGQGSDPIVADAVASLMRSPRSTRRRTPAVAASPGA